MTTRTRKRAGAGAATPVAAPVAAALEEALAALGLAGDAEPAATQASVEAALPGVDGTWVTVPLSGTLNGVLVAALGEPVVADLVDAQGEAPVLLGALAAAADALGASPGDVASGEGWAGLAPGAGTVSSVGLRQDGERVLSLFVVARPEGAPEPAVFPSLETAASAPSAATPAAAAALGGTSTGDPVALTLIRGVEMQVTAELGRTTMTVRELLQLGPGSVIELDRAAGSPVDLLVNGTLIARGEVVVIDEEYGIRVSQIVDPAEER